MGAAPSADPDGSGLGSEDPDADRGSPDADPDAPDADPDTSGAGPGAPRSVRFLGPGTCAGGVGGVSSSGSQRSQVADHSAPTALRDLAARPSPVRSSSPRSPPRPPSARPAAPAAPGLPTAPAAEAKRSSRESAAAVGPASWAESSYNCPHQSSS
ncbi:MULTISPECIES: hypothetical protein [unclassified Streptomyces]|uniref:hypothetical protein n=1 Tax=unclassified Streptomyces TaxID=2593676 RepID=UPI003D70D360